MTDTQRNSASCQVFELFAFLRVLCDLEAKNMLTERARLKAT